MSEDREDRDADGDRDAPLSDVADRVRRSRSERESAAARDPFADLDEATAGADADADDPFADLDEADADADDPFETMDVETVDDETVWESLESDDPSDPQVEQPELGAASGAERVDPAEAHADRPEHVVEKASYCQRCRYLSAPPETSCSHDGTEIVEVVDSERFRVRGCPMVGHGGPGPTDRD